MMPMETSTKANRVPMFVSSMISAIGMNAAKNATKMPVMIVAT